jgi:hypothetical protein
MRTDVLRGVKAESGVFWCFTFNAWHLSGIQVSDDDAFKQLEVSRERGRDLAAGCLFRRFFDVCLRLKMTVNVIVIVS